MAAHTHNRLVANLRVFKNEKETTPNCGGSLNLPQKLLATGGGKPKLGKGEGKEGSASLGGFAGI